MFAERRRRAAYLLVDPWRRDVYRCGGKVRSVMLEGMLAVVRARVRRRVGRLECGLVLSSQVIAFGESDLKLIESRVARRLIGGRRGVDDGGKE
jgi:hypothetical protein